MKRYLLILTLCLIAWPAFGQDAHTAVVDTATADSAWTDSLTAAHWQGGHYLNVSIYGTASWSATVTLQRKFGTSGPWLDVQEWTYSDAVDHSIQTSITDYEPTVYYRVGIDTAYTSGTIYLRLSR